MKWYEQNLARKALEAFTRTSLQTGQRRQRMLYE